MTKADLEATLRKGLQENWETVNIADTKQTDPLDQLKKCEWVLELNLVPPSASSLDEAVYGFKLIGDRGDDFPRLKARLWEYKLQQQNNIKSWADEGGSISLYGNPFFLLNMTGWAYEIGREVDSDTASKVKEAFHSVRFAFQAYPKLAAVFGVTHGETFSPDAFKWNPDASSRVELPSQIQTQLPPGVVVTVQKCALQINRQEETGFFKVQERWENGVLQNQYGTKVPLNNWMNRGIPHCITVSLENPGRSLAYLIGVFDIVEGSLAWINDDLMPKKAFEYVEGKSSKSLEVQFVKNVFHVMKQSSKERETIQAIMNHLQTAVFIPERNRLSKNQQSGRL